jgi:hypothetical protein
LLAILANDPNAVHINLLRRSLARPTVSQIIHIYGEDAIRAALSAASAVRSEGVKVKALEWRGLKASSVFGTYEVIDATGTGKTPHFDVWANFGPDEEVYVTGGFASEAEAKSATQTDYQNRILSAITSPVQTREDGRKVVIEQAAKHFEELARKSESFFAVTTTHREICEAAAKELRSYALSQPEPKGDKT